MRLRHLLIERARRATRSTTRGACRIAVAATVATAMVATAMVATATLGCAGGARGAAPTADASPAPASSLPGAVARAALADPHHPFWSGHAPAIGRIRFETSAGNFVVEVHRDWAPRGVDRLYGLALAGFFDDSRVFRVRAGYIAQFGIAGAPAVAAAWRDAAIPDDSVRRSNVRGTVSYAMTGPNTRTTQLFVNLADNAHLDVEGFAPVGVVVEGMDVVDRLYAGYGESAGGGMRGGKQAPLFEGGNAWLDAHYPRLDRIVRARAMVPPGGR